MIIHQSADVLNGMDEWCQRTHSQSGLVCACMDSRLGVKEAEVQILDFLNLNFTSSSSSPPSVAGNSVYMDLLFLKKWMPNLHGWLGSKVIDVSTVKELMFRWRPDLALLCRKPTSPHRQVSPQHHY